MPNPTSEQTKSNTSRIIKWSLLGIVVVWLIITVVYPLALGDNANSYNGVKRQLADRFIKLQHDTFSSNPQPSFIMQPRIDDIRPITQSEKESYCDDPLYVSNDPSNPHYYAVVVSVRYLFAFGAENHTYIGCESKGYQAELFGLPERHKPNPEDGGPVRSH